MMMQFLQLFHQARSSIKSIIILRYQTTRSYSLLPTLSLFNWSLEPVQLSCFFQKFGYSSSCQHFPNKDEYLASSYNWANQQMQLMLLEHGFIQGAFIIKCLNKFLEQQVFTTEHSVLLLSACGKKCADYSIPKRQKLMKTIFTKTKQKDIHVYNAFLAAAIDNGMWFIPDDILNEILMASLTLNMTTYVNCIAQFCINGQLKRGIEMLNVMKSHRLVIPSDAYGYIGYALCLHKQSKTAVAMLDYLFSNGFEVSWKTLTVICSGLAQVGEKGLCIDVFRKYIESMETPMLYEHFVSLIEVLLEAEHAAECLFLIDIIPHIQPPDVHQAAYRLRNKPNKFLILHALYSKVVGCFPPKGDQLPGYWMLRHYVNTCHNIEDFRKNIQILSRCYPKFDVNYRALEWLLESKSELALLLLVKMHEAGEKVKPHMLLPFIVGQATEHQKKHILLFAKHKLPFSFSLLEEVILNVNPTFHGVWFKYLFYIKIGLYDQAHSVLYKADSMTAETDLLHYLKQKFFKNFTKHECAIIVNQCNSIKTFPHSFNEGVSKHLL